MCFYLLIEEMLGSPIQSPFSPFTYQYSYLCPCLFSSNLVSLVKCLVFSKISCVFSTKIYSKVFVSLIILVKNLLRNFLQNIIEKIKNGKSSVGRSNGVFSVYTIDRSQQVETESGPLCDLTFLIHDVFLRIKYNSSM